MNEPIQNPSFHASKVPPRLMAEADLWPKQYGNIFWFGKHLKKLFISIHKLEVDVFCSLIK